MLACNYSIRRSLYTVLVVIPSATFTVPVEEAYCQTAQTSRFIATSPSTSGRGFNSAFPQNDLESDTDPLLVEITPNTVESRGSRAESGGFAQVGSTSTASPPAGLQRASGRTLVSSDTRNSGASASISTEASATIAPNPANLVPDGDVSLFIYVSTVASMQGLPFVEPDTVSFAFVDVRVPASGRSVRVDSSAVVEYSEASDRWVSVQQPGSGVVSSLPTSETGVLEAPGGFSIIARLGSADATGLFDNISVSLGIDAISGVGSQGQAGGERLGARATAFVLPMGISSGPIGIPALPIDPSNPGTTVIPEFGDFDFDLTIDADDIDRLFEEIATTSGSVLEDPTNPLPPSSPLFDLTVDTVVDRLDVEVLVRDILGTEFGDANLDGRVDQADVSILGTNFGSVGGWAQGDFSGDGVVGPSDASILGGFFGFPTNASSAVPEPSASLLLGTLAAFASISRSRTN